MIQCYHRRKPKLTSFTLDLRIFSYPLTKTYISFDSFAYIDVMELTCFSKEIHESMVSGKWLLPSLKSIDVRLFYLFDDWVLVSECSKKRQCYLVDYSGKYISNTISLSSDIYLVVKRRVLFTPASFSAISVLRSPFHWCERANQLEMFWQEIIHSEHFLFIYSFTSVRKRKASRNRNKSLRLHVGSTRSANLWY